MRLGDGRVSIPYTIDEPDILWAAIAGLEATFAPGALVSQQDDLGVAGLLVQWRVKDSVWNEGEFSDTSTGWDQTIKASGLYFGDDGMRTPG